MMAYDAARDKAVLFGGISSGGTPLGDTWTWNGASWAQVATTGPAPRFFSAMAYDPTRQRVVLFGGNGGTGGTTLFADTWEWDGTSWMQVATTGPSAHVLAAAAYDPMRRAVVMFGGGSIPDNQLWVWNGAAWQQVVPAISPTGRRGAGLAYHSPTGKLVLFGGETATSGPFFGDAWTIDAPVVIAVGPQAAHPCSSGGAAFTVVARGTGPLSYAWRKGTVPIDITANPSAATATLSLTNISASDVASYDCVVINSCGSMTSNPATLSICYADLTCDTQVDDADFVFFATAYDLLVCDDPAMPANCPADLNGDSLVDDADFVLFANAYDALLCS